MNAKIVAFFAYCLLLIACGTITTHSVLTGTPGAPRAGEIRIVMGEEAPPPGLTEVGIVQAVGHGSNADLEHVIEGLKEKSLSLGCTVIAKVKIDQGATKASGTGVCLRP
ncbi:MAG TPA: hypothetical protein VJV79_40060 [Polyangiaceae bacterium]|nr:hypothetical protein [Polyangiaceae bacterium]